MKTSLTLLLAAIAVFIVAALTGCGTYATVHRVTDPATKITTEDTTRAHAFFYKLDADKLRGVTKDGIYSHTLAASGVAASGDPETLKVFMDGAANIAEKTAKGVAEGVTGKPPTP